MCKVRALAMPAACIVLFAALLGAQGVITTVAGTTWRFTGDGGPATNAPLGGPSGVAVDAAGNLFATDCTNQIVVKISSAGVLTVVAGNGIGGFSGDGGPATGARFSCPWGLALDSAGNVYIADYSNNRVRKVSPTGTITTIAGAGASGFSGDGGPAISARFANPTGVAVDTTGNVYIADTNNQRVRRASPDGTITTVAGNGTASYSGDGGPATLASVNNPFGIAVDAAGSLYIADTKNNRIRKIPRGGVITTVAGNGTCGFSGDLGPAVSASLCGPDSVALDSAGNLYIADDANRRVRKVSPSGVITTVAGTGASAFPGMAVRPSTRLSTASGAWPWTLPETCMSQTSKAGASASSRPVEPSAR